MRLETVGTTLVAKLDGEIDQSNATEIREKIDREISLNNMKNLVLDFDKVTFMDSSGIGMLIGRVKLIKARGGKILIIRTQPQVDKIIELAGLKKIMDFE
jgi:stage II sporulation protein AA (anti-sigma F factor antagonist)